MKIELHDSWPFKRFRITCSFCSHFILGQVRWLLMPFHSRSGQATPPVRRPPPFWPSDVCINLARIFKLMMLNGCTKNTKYACRMQATVSSCRSVCGMYDGTLHHSAPPEPPWATLLHLATWRHS